jgi:hypothetical protein
LAAICFGPENIQVILPMHKQQTNQNSSLHIHRYTAYEPNKFLLPEIDFYLPYMHDFGNAYIFDRKKETNLAKIHGGTTHILTQ